MIFKRIIYLLIAIFHFYLFAVVCAQSDWLLDMLDSFSKGFEMAAKFYLGISFFIFMGFISMAKGEPFSHFMLKPVGKGRTPQKHSNIKDFLEYRNGLMGGMSPSKSARLMMDTSIVDAIHNGTYEGGNTQDTADYINGMLGGLSPSSQVNFITNRYGNK